MGRGRRRASAASRGRTALLSGSCSRSSSGSSPSRASASLSRCWRLVNSERRRRCQSINCSCESSGPAGSPTRLNAFGSSECASTSRAIAFGVERVGLAALASAIGARGAVRAHVAHVLAVAGQEHGRVPAPTGRVLDPPTRDRPERPRPRLKRPMPLARDAEMLAGQQSAARVDHGRRQRALVRIDPDHVAGVIGREQQMRGPGAPALASGHHALPSRPAVGDTVASADRPTTSRWAREFAKRSYQVKPILEGHNRGRHFVHKTPRQRVRQLASQTPVEPSTLRQPSPTRAPRIPTPGQLRAWFGPRVQGRERRWAVRRPCSGKPLINLIVCLVGEAWLRSSWRAAHPLPGRFGRGCFPWDRPRTDHRRLRTGKRGPNHAVTGFLAAGG